jgi:hypothetical protein
MTKHAMWMALEHRRWLEGLPSRGSFEPMPVTMLEASLPQEGQALNESSDGEPHDGECDSETCAGCESDGEALGPSAVGVPAAVPTTSATGSAKPALRRKNDTFYDDYLHRGRVDVGAAAAGQRTPLADMSYLL